MAAFFHAGGFAELIRQRLPLEVLLALRHVKTVCGAERIYWAEKAGHCRRVVLRAAARRIEELGGTEPDLPRTNLIAAAEVVEPRRRVYADR